VSASIGCRLIHPPIAQPEFHRARKNDKLARTARTCGKPVALRSLRQRPGRWRSCQERVLSSRANASKSGLDPWSTLAGPIVKGMVDTSITTLSPRAGRGAHTARLWLVRGPPNQD
jgi:hypothetical protein